MNAGNASAIPTNSRPTYLAWREPKTLTRCGMTIAARSSSGRSKGNKIRRVSAGLSMRLSELFEEQLVMENA
jgi:hypothetical protein